MKPNYTRPILFLLTCVFMTLLSTHSSAQTQFTVQRKIAVQIVVNATNHVDSLFAQAIKHHIVADHRFKLVKRPPEMGLIIKLYSQPANQGDYSHYYNAFVFITGSDDPNEKPYPLTVKNGTYRFGEIDHTADTFFSDVTEALVDFFEEHSH